MNDDVFMIDEIKIVAERTAAALLVSNPSFGPVYFMPGHPMEIAGRLQAMTSAPISKDKKYPLIILFTDIKIVKRTQGFYGRTRLRMLVATLTKPEYYAEQRTEKTFRPILHPIKRELMKQMYRYPNFSFESEQFYDETDMYFYGSIINNKNIFNDYIDAIELNDIDILIHNNICTPKNNFYNGK